MELSDGARAPAEFTKGLRLDFRQLRKKKLSDTGRVKELRSWFLLICVGFFLFIFLHSCSLCLCRSRNGSSRCSKVKENLKWKVFSYIDACFLIWAPCRLCAATVQYMKACQSLTISRNAAVENMMNISSKQLTSCLFMIRHDFLIMQIVQFKKRSWQNRHRKVVTKSLKYGIIWKNTHNSCTTSKTQIIAAVSAQSWWWGACLNSHQCRGLLAASIVQSDFKSDELKRVN